MTTLLRIDSSATQPNSHSKALADYYIEHLRASTPRLHVIEDNIGLHPTPHLSQPTIGAMYTPADSRTAEQTQALQQSDQYIQNLKAADTIMISAPMYNFSIPSTLKAYFDHIARVGETFQYGETGPQGLLSGKQAIVIIATGGDYTREPYSAINFVAPVIKQVLSFIGIDDVRIIQAPNMAKTGAPQQDALAAAKAELNALL